MNPIDHGADIIMHSLTKYGWTWGGYRWGLHRLRPLDWEASGKFPTLTEPYDGYHGLDFAESLGRKL